MAITSIIEGMKRSVVFEYAQQRQQLLLWLPIFLSFGIGAYFILPTEPPLALGFLSAIAGLFIFVLFRHREVLFPLFIFMFALGFFAAQMRTHYAHTPVLQKDIGPVDVVGTISSIEDLGDNAGSRLVLSDVHIEDLGPLHTPRKIRLKLWNDEGLQVGQRIAALAKIHPPSPPVMPGGFDFQRYLYFKGIGGVGFIYKDVQRVEGFEPLPFAHGTEKLRQNIAQRVEQYIEYPEAAIVMALMIGRKTAIHKTDQEAMRGAGLAHMLAISGLHVGLFSGALFFMARLFMALIPSFALRFPIKKYATIFAISGAVFYMFLAGATIPTQRAVLMISIVFLAIILDRSPISLRLVAFAAFVVLFIFPESLLSASFHMSFAAVTGLIAFYGWLRPYWSQWYGQAGIVRRAGLYFLGICFTSIVATLATAPFALFHFNQLATYGLIGNVLAMPILAFMIMPAILLALVLMPIGLEFLPFKLAALGAEWLLEIAHWVSNIPHAFIYAPSWPPSALIGLAIGGLIVILFHRYMKLLCLVPISISMFIIINYNQYDIIVSSSNKLLAFYLDNEEVYVSTRRKDRFVRKNWVQAYGAQGGGDHIWPKEGRVGPVSCDEMACRVTRGAFTLSYLKTEAARDVECSDHSVDVVVAAFPIRECGDKRVIDLYDGRYKGAHGLHITEEGVQVDSVEVLRGKRPWSGYNSAFSAE